MREVFELCVHQLDQGGEQFPWHVRDAYGDWLAQTYYYVSHSTRLLASAAARFALDGRGNALHQRFGKHIAEEDRHELLALHDLETLGFSIDQFRERDATRMFYEPQYYKVEHQDPLALFGYILPLEAIAVSKGKWLLERVDALYGRGAGSFLRVHAAEDVEHLEKAFAALDGITAEQSRLIETNLRQSTQAYLGILRELRADYEGAGARAA